MAVVVVGAIEEDIIRSSLPLPLKPSAADVVVAAAAGGIGGGGLGTVFKANAGVDVNEETGPRLRPPPTTTGAAASAMSKPSGTPLEKVPHPDAATGTVDMVS